MALRKFANSNLDLGNEARREDLRDVDLRNILAEERVQRELHEWFNIP